MSAALRAHVAVEMGREAAIAKERRKAQESKSEGRSRGKGAKGGPRRRSEHEAVRG